MDNSLSIWDKSRNLINQLGETITYADAVRRYGAVATVEKVLIEENPSGQLIAIDDLEVLRAIYGIAQDLSDADTITEIIRIRETPPEPIPTPITEADLQHFLDIVEGRAN